jgi:hypothetical protein
MAKIQVGSTVYTEYIFTINGINVDPDSFVSEVYIYDSLLGEYVSQNPFQSITLTRVSEGIYTGEWANVQEGIFKLEVIGSFNDINISSIKHEKYFLIGESEVIKDLDYSYLVTMLGPLTPVYVDPEFILQYYSSGDLVEITEIIHRKSLDLESKLGLTSLEPISALQHDYIVAATMCELSRIYGMTNGGLTGFTSAARFKLGDLEVDKGTTGGRLPSGSYDLGNAGSWCELAAVLKSQLRTASETFRPVVPGAAYPRVILGRELASDDYN